MIAIIAILTIATIAIASLILAPHVAERQVIFDDSPDKPCGFGPDMTWIAVKTNDYATVIDAVGGEQPIAANWNSGIGTIYNAEFGPNRIFVSSPVDGWVFVIGTALPHPQGHAFVDKCTPLLMHLGERFKEVQYFASYPDLDLFAWAKIVSGRIRAFGVGDEGVIWNRGRTTREERTLGLKLFELRGVRGRKGDAGGELLMHPTQEHVMRVAGHWSINPTLLDTSEFANGLGAVCLAPSAWRTERLRKTA
jgi:hypothetical protein